MTTYLSDLFTDTDNTALTAHTMDTGAGWTANTGTFKISSNAAVPNAIVGGEVVATASAAASSGDVTLTCDMTPWTNGSDESQPGVIFRFSDINNYWLLQLHPIIDLLELYKKEGGSYTLVDSISTTIDTGVTYSVTIIAEGSNIGAQMTGGATVRAGSTFNATATGFGMRLGQTGPFVAGVSWDNFQVGSVTNTTWFYRRYAGNPVVANGANGTFDDGDVAAPDVFWDTPNNRWVMNYSGYDGAQWHTGIAYSTDLLTWTKEAANPVFSPNGNEGYIAANGTIAYKGGTYYLWYNRYPTPANIWSICLATSTNLISWTRQNGGNPVQTGPESYASDPFVRLLSDGVTFEMFYHSLDSAVDTIRRATSTDGITWTEQGILALNQVGHINLGAPNKQANSDTNYRLYYDLANPVGYRRTHMSSTTDGSTFTYNRAQLMESGTGWDSVQVFDSCPVVVGNTVYLIYAGAPAAGPLEGFGSQLGVATAKLSATDPVVVATPPIGRTVTVQAVDRTHVTGTANRTMATDKTDRTHVTDTANRTMATDKADRTTVIT